jgi:hypothetical protein
MTGPSAEENCRTLCIDRIRQIRRDQIGKDQIAKEKSGGEEFTLRRNTGFVER